MSAIDEIKERLDIVDVISRYVKLQKSGQNFRGLCPFHSEKHGSFFVFPQRQSWHCFGACARGGDVFSFVMKKEGLDFGQALRLLADQAGVTLDRDVKQNEKTDRPYEINETAADYYHDLLVNSPDAQHTRDYLQKRKISAESIRTFKLGLSPDDRGALGKYLRDRGYQEEELVAAGLRGEREGTAYDYFRHRLMFPIRNLRGRTIGFGARALDDSQPKYLNSPQTAIFDKGSCLYGIDRAREAIRQKSMVVIVEGYTDVIAAHQQGFGYVVASMGTSLTAKQVAILKKLTKTMLFALDADAAGRQAALHSIETAEQAMDRRTVPVPHWTGLMKYEEMLDGELRVVLLPAGKDPDEVIHDDPALWQRLCDSATPAIDFSFQMVTGKLDLSRYQDKAQARDKLLPHIAGISEPMRSHYVYRLASLLHADERDLKDRLERLRADKEGSRKRATGAVSTTPSLPASQEEYLLSLLLRYPGLKPEATRLLPEYFESTQNLEIMQKWLAAEDIESLRDSLNPALQECLDNLLDKITPAALKFKKGKEKEEFEQCLLNARERYLRHLEAKRQVLVQEFQSSGAVQDLAEIEKQGIEIGRQLREVFERRATRRQDDHRN